MRTKKSPSIVFVAVIAVVTMLAVMPASSYVQGVDVANDGSAGTNDPEYWEDERPSPLPPSTGESCTKEDGSGSQWSGDTFIATSAYSQIVLKFSTINTPFYDVEVGDVLVTHTNQDISHVILCTGGSSTTTTSTSTPPCVPAEDAACDPCDDNGDLGEDCLPCDAVGDLGEDCLPCDDVGDLGEDCDPCDAVGDLGEDCLPCDDVGDLGEDCTTTTTTTTIATEVLGEVEVADPADPVDSAVAFTG